MSAGGIMAGAVVSLMVTFWYPTAVLPEPSVATHSTVVVPSGKPSDGALFVTDEMLPELSDTIGRPSDNNFVSKPVASLSKLGGLEILGGIVSNAGVLSVPLPESCCGTPTTETENFWMLPELSLALASIFAGPFLISTIAYHSDQLPPRGMAFL
jgi:hypothetical protein